MGWYEDSEGVSLRGDNLERFVFVIYWIDDSEWGNGDY